jgi:hypothetical protein
MLSLKIDNLNLNKILDNSVLYSQGFLEGIELDRIEFNRRLGGFAAEALGMYIDVNARMSPQTLHHVYEWNKVGDSSARLFSINVKADKNNIMLYGSFLQSKSISKTSKQPFPDKANVMENGIAITITPKPGHPLEFEVNGEPVFVSHSVTIEHPGGDGVAGSFGKIVSEFFDSYFTNAILQPFMKHLSELTEYTSNFPEGARGGGRSRGVRAGRQYLNDAGMML